MREAPSRVLAARFLAEGAQVVAWDPVARRGRSPARHRARDTAAEAVRGADAAVVVTEWPELRELPWGELRETMRTRS